ncbi:MAG: HD domain-containing protein [Spirochaetales bacterium]|nr:HD domain-containing protein [Spirochaetales bacterium]
MSGSIDSTALEAYLTPRRLAHSLAVTELCLHFNERFRLDLAEADLRAVGLGHDIARSWSEEDLRSYIETRKIALHPGEEAVVDLLHAPVGADLLRRMGYNEDVVRAVRYHTLGSLKMGKLGFVLFASDYLDPNRTFLPEEDRALLLAEPTIEDLVFRILKRSVRYLADEGKRIFEPTRELLAALGER